MSKNEKIKFTVYLDDEMLKKTDKAVLASGCKSRNEFVIKAIESYIAEVISQSNDVALKKVSSCLFRYAVFLDMTIQMVADYMEIDEFVLEEYRKRAYNNVRRTKGRMSLDELLRHTGIRDEE